MRLVQSRNQRPEKTIHHRWSGRHSKGTKNSLSRWSRDRGAGGAEPGEVLADSGYCSEDNFKYLHGGTSMDMWLPRQSTDTMGLLASEGPLPKGSNAVERMKRKLQTRVGRRIYAMRKAIVEPVFGQIKQAARKTPRKAQRHACIFMHKLICFYACERRSR